MRQVRQVSEKETHFLFDEILIFKGGGGPQMVHLSLVSLVS